jgi:hypothetical protein
MTISAKNAPEDLPKSGTDGACWRSDVKSVTAVDEIDFDALLIAIQNFGNHATVGSQERNDVQAFGFSGGLDARCAGPHEFAEVSEVIVDAGVGDFVSVLVDDDDRMLDVGIGIAVNR